MYRKKHLTLKTKTIILVVLTVLICILTIGGIVSYNVNQNQKQVIKNEISSTANIVANDDTVKRDLASHQKPSKNSYLQHYAQSITNSTKTDFIVILNNDLVRYTYPKANHIGKRFSSPNDASKSSHGRIHYSHRRGVLGNGYRVFKPIYYHHNQVGVVCVGMTDKSIAKVTKQADQSVILGSLIALIVGVLLATILAEHVKKILFGMEPDEIATKLTEFYAINNSMDEALIAINTDDVVITMNSLAKRLFKAMKIGQKIDNNLYTTIFLNHAKARSNEIVLVNSKELVVSTNQLIYKTKNYGQIALLKDQSKFQKLSNQLAGTQQYIQSLRAQSHEFLNKLQAISGMIELGQYSEVNKFITQVNNNYQIEFGNLNQQIQSPALVGFLMGKINQSSEQAIKLIVTKNSNLPAQVANEQLNVDLIKILGNLIDNSIDAIKNKGTILVSLNYDVESHILIIEVSDNGSGIPDNIKETILRKNYSTKGKDRGYGLTLINQIVKEHDGFLDISNNKPHGTVVYVELPIKDEQK